MLNLKNSIVLVCLTLMLLLFAGCNLNQKKESVSQPDVVDAEAEMIFQQEKKELLDKANAELSAINQRILTCNEKIKKGIKLTDAQNKALDAFEAKRASINKRIHEIKNVQYAEWDSFKKQFEEDLTNASADIEKILTEL